MRLMLVPMMNEAVHSLLELFRGAKASVAQHSSFDNGKPYLHLVEPRRVQGRIDEVKPLTVFRVELSPAFIGAIEMDVEIVPYHEDLAARITTRYLVHIADKRLRCTVRKGPSEDKAIGDIK